MVLQGNFFRMFSKGSEDKNHLAMLAIPVILSMVLGFAGEVRAEDSPDRAEGTVVRETEAGDDGHNGLFLEEGMEERARRRALEHAIAGGDYESFLLVANDTPFAEIMTKDAFDELVEQYTLQKIGFRPSSPNYYV